MIGILMHWFMHFVLLRSFSVEFSASDFIPNPTGDSHLSQRAADCVALKFPSKQNPHKPFVQCFVFSEVVSF